MSGVGSLLTSYVIFQSFFLNISHLALRILWEHELYWTDDNKPIFTSLETRAEQKYDDSFYNCYVIYAMFNVYTSI